MNALLNYYMPGLEVSQMSDQEWVFMVASLMKIRKEERKSSGN